MSLSERAERILKAKLRRLMSESVADGGGAERLDGRKDEDWARTRRAPTARRDPQEVESLAILGLSASATRDDIRVAYRRLCKRYHPDRFAASTEKARLANDLLAEINAAYAFLQRRR